MNASRLPDAAWAKVASILLEEASAEFSSHGCNDFYLDCLSREEQVALVECLNEWNGSPEEVAEDVAHLPLSQDSSLMGACAEWLRQVAKR